MTTQGEEANLSHIKLNLSKNRLNPYRKDFMGPIGMGCYPETTFEDLAMIIVSVYPSTIYFLEGSQSVRTQNYL